MLNGRLIRFTNLPPWHANNIDTSVKFLKNDFKIKSGLFLKYSNTTKSIIHETCSQVTRSVQLCNS